ncbi:hypothetical protein Sjap_010506 [Stephania japonica]|uniref:FAR1 domain-containing protein n=1 Tax=Stephania japonica TaxID=461633 RepID=A0AAP0J9I7_9MAGN
MQWTTRVRDVIVASDGEFNNGHDEERVSNANTSEGEVELPEPPKERMVFPTIEDVTNFYKSYAWRVGFGIKLRASFRKHGVIWKYMFACVRQGSTKSTGKY